MLDSNEKRGPKISHKNRQRLFWAPDIIGKAKECKRNTRVGNFLHLEIRTKRNPVYNT